MGASFRNVGEIKVSRRRSVAMTQHPRAEPPPILLLRALQALAGVDYLTIAPKLLEELKNSTDEVKQVLVAETAKQDKSMAKVSYIDNEPEFRWSLLEDQMAFEKLHEGIRQFGRDGQTLADTLRSKLQ